MVRESGLASPGPALVSASFSAAAAQLWVSELTSLFSVPGFATGFASVPSAVVELATASPELAAVSERISPESLASATASFFVVVAVVRLVSPEFVAAPERIVAGLASALLSARLSISVMESATALAPELV